MMFLDGPELTDSLAAWQLWSLRLHRMNSRDESVRFAIRRADLVLRRKTTNQTWPPRIASNDSESFASGSKPAATTRYALHGYDLESDALLDERPLALSPHDLQNMPGWSADSLLVSCTALTPPQLAWLREQRVWVAPQLVYFLSELDLAAAKAHGPEDGCSSS